MQGLYPIIRRKRRPLVVSDEPPVVVADVEPVDLSHEEAQNAQERTLADAREPMPFPTRRNSDEQDN